MASVMMLVVTENRMKVLLSQVNPTVADTDGNTRIILDEITFGFQNEVDVVLLPELVTVGYPPRDYLYQRWIWDVHEKIAQTVLSALRGFKRQMTVIFGGLDQVRLSYGRKEPYNAAYIIDPHYGIRVVHKRLLPEYDVFNEARYFKPACDDPIRPIPIAMPRKNGKGLYYEFVDVLICEDIWNNRFQGDSNIMPAYDLDCIEQLKGTGPLFVINGSPYWTGKVETTKRLVEDICARINRPVCWVNQVGAQDDIITGGYSMTSIPVHNMDLLPNHDPRNRINALTRVGKPFQNDRMVVRFDDQESKHNFLGVDLSSKDPYCYDRPMLFGKQIEACDFEVWCDYQACKLFIQDYARRCGFKKAVLGLSGGIDSALVAVLAADALGPENVICVSLPSSYSSEHSKTDAQQLAQNLGADFRTVTIGDLHEMVRGKFLSGGRQKFDSDLTDENIQPRLRALILMTISNDENALLLTTGNKSEISVGYCTIYGDMCGGIAPISDIWKTDVFAMCRFINRYRPVIPSNTVEKPPSAELRPEQRDTDSLPPYHELDPILKMIVERDMTVPEIVQELGSDNVPPWAVDMYRKYKISEYKRKQMPPGAKIRKRSFGSGRQMPIAVKETRL
jgi:NAD+ synthase (glutamine-hydrolysing)